MGLGIRSFLRLAATQSVASSTVLVDATGMSIPIGASQKIHIRGMLYLTVGAAGGAKIQVVPTQTPASFACSILLENTVAPAAVSAMQIVSAAFADALANAGNHYIFLEADIVNGATAGVVKLQFAQNSSNATACQLLLGSFFDCIVV